MKVLRATYGAGECQLDVTPKLRALVKDGRLDFTVSNALFTDPCVNRFKVLEVTYQVENSLSPVLRRALEGEVFKAPDTPSKHEMKPVRPQRSNLAPPLRIVHATYGAGDCQLDVSQKLQKMVGDGALCFTVSNQHFSDPCPNKLKTLHLVYEHADGGFCRDIEVREHDTVVAPLRGGNRIGIFYTNNTGQNPYLDLVLRQLKVAAKDVDVLTCPWHPIQGNPFPQLPWKYHVGGHSTMYLQILKLLYTAQEVGNYEYVFFLEHDVLYPEGYFDIEPFEEDVLENTHYMGLCELGFQPKRSNLRPLFQLVMKLPAAIDHFTESLRGALIGNRVANEPYTRRFASRHSQYPAVHINFGKHFTSYHTTFSKDVIEESHPYWGDAADWWDSSTVRPIN